MIKVEVIVNEDTLRDLFDNAGVKFSKKKAKVLKDLVDEQLLDISERLEEELTEVLGEMIEEEWGE